MSIGHFELERSSLSVNGGSLEERWHKVGLTANDLHQMARIMNTYDPEGTTSLRVWDHILDEPVPPMAMALVCGYENGRKAGASVPIIVDWKNDGF